MADVWLAPYLPLGNEQVVGPWLLVPFQDFSRRHACSHSIYNEVRRLRTAYKLRNAGLAHFGAIIVPNDGRVGDEQPRSLLRPFYRALVASAIDGNPSYLDAEEDANVGHSLMTAENALVFGHPLTGERSYVIQAGAMAQRIDLRYVPPGHRLPPVPPPPDLPTPLFSRLDTEYATALYLVLTSGDVTARRLDRAIEWLGLAWNNSAAVSEDARVLVLRAAFEVLLGGGSDTRLHRERLSGLLDEPGATRTLRSWPKLKSPVKLTALEWWFQSFGLLRNKIAHGDQMSPEDFMFDDGKRHLWHADDVLRRALKRTVVRAGQNPDLELGPVSRSWARSRRSALAKLSSSAVEES